MTRLERSRNGAVFHAVTDVKPETIEALKALVRIVRDMPDDELRNVEAYAKYLASKHKRKSRKS